MKILIILTCTVSPDLQENLLREDPEIRLRDYIQSILKWKKMAKKHGFTLAVVENSNSIDELRAKLSAMTTGTEEIFFLGIERDTRSSNEGKSAGEYQLLKQTSQILDIDSFTYIAKVTGRLYVRNFPRLLKKMDKAALICNKFFKPNQLVDSRLVLFEPDIFRKCFQDEVRFSEKLATGRNDHTYRSMEHYLTQKLLDFGNSHIKVGNFNQVIDYVGHSASTNKKLDTNFLRLLISVSNKLRNFAIKILLGVAP